ncbi:Xaa-Pro aminopeptidase [Thalassobaculum fulvum]|uniref:Xaa-Pro aminopeptidase n=1 Tax=Thalassobaculum fulvum TaxID=1633335 RepID=A0A918XVU4_9PROT|nr:aminopeptidase P family protein [Thalassobaculum fulvum]GHD57436.1 Xaa-Pro aminopeptidase [Thalassobaculum fulvum]
MTAPDSTAAQPAAAPQADDELARLMAGAGIAGSPADLRATLSRIAASPDPYPADAWLGLVAPDAAPETADALTALRDALRPAEPAADPSRLERLRAALHEAGVDGLILPRADEHQGEYIPPSAERLAWLTGFTGSAGTVVVLPERAALFVDGRYTLQAGRQVDTGRWEIRHLIRTPAAAYIGEHLAGRRLGYDPRLHSVNAAKRLHDAVRQAGGTLMALEDNPVDRVWSDRPPAPLGRVEALPAEISGVTAAAKRALVAGILAERDAGVAVLNQPESIAWLLNIRGRDVPYTPLPLCYATVARDGSVELFLDPAKCDAATRAALGNQVSLRPFEAIGQALDDLGEAGATVSLDPDTASEWLHQRLAEAGATVVTGEDPCIRPRARKNPVEIAGTRAAHVRDAAAVARFLKWIDDSTAAGRVTELAAAEALERFRSVGERWRGPSFATISGAGPNGAIVHYRVTAETDRPLESGSLYLIDSGAQYLDGTTDITRTVAIGTPTQEMRERFTLVLKGHIAIATARFPAGTTGSQLDALARQFLWKEGLDFDHGTGHGVGSFLGVHEGPQRISSAGKAVIEAGMILSNEPGYYKPDGYGIRIENLLLTVESEPAQDTGRPMLAFETLTFAPIDRRLIEPALLSFEERAWIDAYHATVRRRVAPALDAAEREWLETATALLDA